MAAIRTEALTKHYGDVTALDGLDLTVESGEVFGFLGPNGAGKSTTINVLLGFLEPTAGRVEVLGTDVLSDSRAVRRRMGVLPEDFEPYERLTAREHISYAADLKGADPDPAHLLDRTGLDPDAWDRRAGNYSTGMCQRLALACALVGDPDLLVLDEPSSGLDPQGMAEMRDLILTEAESGTTVFFSSHILSEVEAVADRVGILADGHLVATGTLDELRAGAAARAPLRLDVADVPDGLVADVADAEGVADAWAEDGSIHAELSDPARKVAVIEAVNRETTVEDVISEAASLEAMFTMYTDGETDAERAAVAAGDAR
ncbi:MAG: ABC transporter ATP-binding protein [Halobacteriaceae archaeon]